MSRLYAFMMWFICLCACVLIIVVQLLQAIFGSTQRAINIAIGVDQTANALLGGLPGETISARVHRCGWKRAERFINWLFSDPAHCRKAYESEMTLSHLPNEYRSG